MHIQLEKHKANIHYISDNPSFNETIVFIPGAGMDHRTAQMVGFGLPLIKNSGLK